MAKKQELPRIVLRREKDPSQLGAREPTQLGGVVGNYLPPGAQYEYKPPSMFAQHRGLSIVFAALVFVTLLYWAFAPKHARHPVESAVAPAAPAPPAPPRDEPVYIQPVAPR